MSQAVSPSPPLSIIKGFLMAAQFLTVLPVPASSEDPKAFGRPLLYFPLVGILLGVVLAAVDLALRPLFSPVVVSTLLVGLLAAMTGALHLDGLADSADGLLAYGRSREERLAIMRDSRVGTFGTVALVLLLLLKLAALISLPDPVRSAALIAAPAFGRWAIVYSYTMYPYARSGNGASAALKASAGWAVLMVGMLWTASATLLVGASGLLVLAMCAGLGAPLIAAMAARLSGITGDTCGAACEVGETSFWLLIPVAYALSGG